MSATDPQRTWWDALERGDYGPRGPLHSFRSGCPLCGSDNPTALHVFVGADGRAVPHCFVCEGHPRAIALAAGLDPRDSFPAGHHKARRRSLSEARRADFHGNARSVANILKALELLGAPQSYWQFESRGCAFCGDPGALLTVTSWGQRPWLSCPSGCTLDEHLQALAGRVQDRKVKAA